jgi:hypothetical protein
MTDLEIDKALALAIGWNRIAPNTYDLQTHQCWVYTGLSWRLFSHKDPLVIWPIAERYDLFPHRREREWEVARCPSFLHADTAAKAVALAVIKGMNARHQNLAGTSTCYEYMTPATNV